MATSRSKAFALSEDAVPCRKTSYPNDTWSDLNGTEIVINGRFLSQPVTGVQRVARELTRAMDRLVAKRKPAVRLRLVCETNAEIADLGLQVTCIERAGGARGHVWEQAVLPGRVRGGHLLCLGNTAPVASLFACHPTTVMIHDLSYRISPSAYRAHYRMGHRLMLPFIMRRATGLLTVSETERTMLGRLHPNAFARIVTVPNGGWRDGLDIRRKATRPGGGYMLYVGSLSRRKNVHGVIATAVRLARDDGLPTVARSWRRCAHPSRKM